MTSRLRSLAVTVAVVFGTIGAPAAVGGAAACGGVAPHAALVIDTGARVISLCVALDAVEVSGLRLIELAGSQHGLAYGFGLGGGAVCRLDGVGPDGDDCFAAYPEYWGYWHGDGRGGWTWASTGAGSFRVGDGDTEAWVWGVGDSGATHRAPPALVIDDVCEVAAPSPEPTPRPEPTPDPERTPTPAPTPVAVASSFAPGSSADPSGSRSTVTHPKTDTPDRSASRTPAPSVASPSPSSAGTLRAAGDPPTAGGPPAELLVALGLGAALTAGGWLRLRGRSKGIG